MDGKDFLKLCTTGLSGVFAGGAFMINASAHPARMTLDTVNCRKHWLEDFHRAKLFQGGMALLVTTTGCLVYYLDEDSDRRMLWLVGSGIMISVWPWTLLAMKPDINKLLKDDVIETAGETWVRDHIVRWNNLHMVRTVLGASAFGIFMYAMLKK